MTLEVYRAAKRSFAPWRNGGGQTAEIICHPQGACMDSFGWRISTARVEKSGPFSHFPGVIRNLAVLEGGPLRLFFASERHTVGIATPALTFDGAALCECELVGSSALDLNLMTRFPYVGRVTKGFRNEPIFGNLVAAFAVVNCDRPQRSLARHDLVDITSLLSGTEDYADDWIIKLYEVTR